MNTKIRMPWNKNRRRDIHSPRKRREVEVGTGRFPMLIIDIND
jgi:hypothetical protein